MDSTYSQTSEAFSGERVRVAVRTRPLMAHETQRKDKMVVKFDENKENTLICENSAGESKQFTFNAVMDPSTR